MKNSLAKKSIPKFLTGAKVIMLAAAISISFAGCSAGSEKQSVETRGGNSGTPDSQDSCSGTDFAGTGRYMEKKVVDREVYVRADIQKTADGRLALFDDGSGKYYSSGDNGSSWEAGETDWLAALRHDNFIVNAAVSGDGTIVLTYSPNQDMGQDTENGAEAQELGTLETEIDPHYLRIAPDGTQTAFELSLENEEAYIRKFFFTESGKLFGSIWGNTIYEINLNDGSAQGAVALEERPVYFQIRGNLLLAVTYGGAVLYDMEAGTFIEDEVLQDFIRDNYRAIKDFGNGYNFYLFAGEEGVVYLASEKGLYRHAIGGSSVEQLIDGSLSSLGDPSHRIIYAALVDNQEFLVNYNDGDLVKFTYDADVSATPAEKITVYSLEENDTVRQAISVFQTENPQMYVTYETGMEEGVTREDALKKISTQLLGGSGPDVLILDDMPYDSYAEKGILMDLESMLQEVETEQELFDNLLKPLYADENLYMVPAEFQLPVIAGHQGQVSQVEDYETLADALEQIRKEQPEAQLIEKCSGRGILRSAIMVCAPSWKNPDNSIHVENLRAFLAQSKRIYDAQMQGTPQEALDSYQSQCEAWLADEGISWEESRFFNYADAGEYLMKNEQLFYGVIYDLDSYAGILASSKIKDFEDTELKVLNGQSKNVYLPMTMAGINAAAENREAACLFIKTLLGESVQESTHYGYPVRKRVFEKKLTVEEGQPGTDGCYAMFGMTADDGTTFTWNVYEPDEEQRRQITDWALQADTPYIRDTILEDAVYAQGVKYLEGEQGLDEAVKAVVDSVAIYLYE